MPEDGFTSLLYETARIDTVNFDDGKYTIKTQIKGFDIPMKWLSLLVVLLQEIDAYLDLSIPIGKDGCFCS